MGGLFGRKILGFFPSFSLNYRLLLVKFGDEEIGLMLFHWRKEFFSSDLRIRLCLYTWVLEGGLPAAFVTEEVDSGDFF